MKYVVFSILIFLFGFGVSFAQERGIGVTPSEIIVGDDVDWPYTVVVAVTNFSEKKENFEVFFENPDSVAVTASPAVFALDARGSRRVRITFEEPVSSVNGLVKVLSVQTPLEGFTTGTGVNIPFSIQKTNNSKFLANAGESTNSFPFLFGTGLLLATIILLWYLSGIVKPWIWNLNKQ